MSEDDSDWLKRYWELIREGKLVRLTPRLTNLPGQVTAVYGMGFPHIRFEASDGLLPAFVTDTPYVEWHPMESYPGELGERPPTDPHSNLLRAWFW
jgi:hypothetical protein